MAIIQMKIIDIYLKNIICKIKSNGAFNNMLKI